MAIANSSRLTTRGAHGSDRDHMARPSERRKGQDDNIPQRATERRAPTTFERLKGFVFPRTGALDALNEAEELKGKIDTQFHRALEVVGGKK